MVNIDNISIHLLYSIQNCCEDKSNYSTSEQVYIH